MAALNPNIEHEMIDGALYQELVDAHQIMAVPTVILNEESFGQGRMGIEEIIVKLNANNPAEDMAKFNAKDKDKSVTGRLFKVVFILSPTDKALSFRPSISH